MIPEIGERFQVPLAICESRVIEVVGSEPDNESRKIKRVGRGHRILWCVEVTDGRRHGAAFAIGSDEFKQFEELPRG